MKYGKKQEHLCLDMHPTTKEPKGSKVVAGLIADTGKYNLDEFLANAEMALKRDKLVATHLVVTYNIKVPRTIKLPGKPPYHGVALYGEPE
jgi:hypothetical protein